MISSRYHEIERQNNDLANLYVASYRLHESLSREEIIGVIQEIVINLIGSEELAIFERANDELDLIASHGIDLEQLRSTMLGSKGVGSVRDVAAGVMDSGACYVASPEQRAQSESNLSACVPLVLNGESIGAIAVFRLLAHKPEFEPLDLELFDLLASHAAVALHYSKRDAADASS
jgi:GAF domain-containing protein